MLLELLKVSRLPQWVREAFVIAYLVGPPIFGYITWEALKLLQRDQMTSFSVDKENDLLKEVGLAEGAQRGYIMTGNQRLLIDFWRHEGSAQDALLAVRESMVLPGQISLVHTQETLVKEKLEEMSEILKLAQTKGFTAAQTRILDGSGIQLMTDILTIGETLVIKQQASQRRAALGW